MPVAHASRSRSFHICHETDKELGNFSCAKWSTVIVSNVTPKSIEDLPLNGALVRRTPEVPWAHVCRIVAHFASPASTSSTRAFAAEM